ncbi:MAG: hypothetical protein V1647_07260 [Pseudomonadota bacterium]
MLKHVPLVIALLSLTSCGKSSNQQPNIDITVNISSEEALPDCTGFKSHMMIPYGLDTPTGQKKAGQKFATMVAVDKKDGTMQITIRPPDGDSNFPVQLLEEFSDYTIKIVACRGAPSSVMNGFSATGVCNTIASINMVGKPSVTSSDFTSEGFIVDGIKVHSTAVPASDPTKKTLRPNVIMLTAGMVAQNTVGDIVMAYGPSPYYAGCYNPTNR